MWAASTLDPVIFRCTRTVMPQLLLALPTDLIRLILSYVAACSPDSIAARFVCRRFRDLLPQRSQDTLQVVRDYCRIAAAYGYLNLIRWARTNGCSWNADTCASAAQGGHLEVLKWARANGCPWDVYTCANAAGGGHLEVLKWARANGCPWNVSTCNFAAQSGHLEVLKWACANGCPCDANTCTRAAQGGHLEVLQWAR